MSELCLWGLSHRLWHSTQRGAWPPVCGGSISPLLMTGWHAVHLSLYVTWDMFHKQYMSPWFKSRKKSFYSFFISNDPVRSWRCIWPCFTNIKRWWWLKHLRNCSIVFITSCAAIRLMSVIASYFCSETGSYMIVLVKHGPLWSGIHL